MAYSISQKTPPMLLYGILFIGFIAFFAAAAIDHCVSNVLSEAQRQASVSKEAAQQVLAALSAARSAASAVGEELQIGDGIVGEGIGLEPSPQVLDRVELRSVRR